MKKEIYMVKWEGSVIVDGKNLIMVCKMDRDVERIALLELNPTFLRRLYHKIGTHLSDQVDGE
jgi:hypothetical protein